VECIGLNLGVSVSGAFGRHSVDDDRAVGGLCAADSLFDLLDVVAVDRSDVLDAELLEEHARLQKELLDRLLDGLTRIDHSFSELSGGETGFDAIAQALIPWIESDARQIARERAHVLRYRHLIVVEDDHDPGAQVADVVERLEGHAARHRSVADHDDYGLIAAGRVAPERQAQRHRQ